MPQKQIRVPVSLGNHTGRFGSWSPERNKLGLCKTLNPLVHHSERGKEKAYNRLQGNKSVFSASTLQARKLARNFSFSAERNVGSKNRFEACIFSPGPSTTIKRLCLHSVGRQSIPVPGRMFWPKYPTHAWQSIMKVFLKKMEKTRNSLLGVPGRHFTGGTLPLFGRKTLNQNALRPT